MNEFDLIARYFTPPRYTTEVLLGVGDDAAVIEVPAGYKLVAAVDTIVDGVHFPFDSNARDIAYRALAVNLSDMAAMGAVPRWFTLSLCMPALDEKWLEQFAAGLNELAAQFKVQLIGGDTVKGPLTISIQILGCVESDGWLTRSGAQAGDLIFVSGQPGEAAGGLQLLMHPQQVGLQTSNTTQTTGTKEYTHLIQRFLRPTPRVQLGRILRNHASAAMDVSDGLLTDLRKLCTASGCGARLQLDQLPVSPALNAMFDKFRSEQLMLSGGDDYELLFTVNPSQLTAITEVIKDSHVRCTQIGTIVASSTVQCFRGNEAVVINDTGFDHFADEHV